MSAKQVRIVSYKQISQENIRVGDPKVKVIISLAIDDLPSGVAMGMPRKGVDLHRDLFLKKPGQKAVQVGNAAKVLSANGKESGRIGEIFRRDLGPQMPCAIDTKVGIGSAIEGIRRVRFISLIVLGRGLMVRIVFIAGIAGDAGARDL